MNLLFMEILTILLILVLIVIISALPLNIAVKLLGGDSSIIKVIGVNLLVFTTVFIINLLVGPLAGIIGFIAMLFIYKISFDLGWFKAFVAWILQAVIVVILGILGTVLLGVSLAAIVL